MLQKFFNVGNITMHKDTANYQVVAMSDLLIILEHFNKYPLEYIHSNIVKF